MRLFERGDENLLPTFLAATTLHVKRAVIFFATLANFTDTDLSCGLERSSGCLRQISGKTVAIGASDPTSASRLASEGHACRARRIRMDYQTLRRGRDRQVPPSEKSEGHACHARRSGMDYPTLRIGRDKRVPPKGGRDKQVPPRGVSEGHACERFRSKPRASSKNDHLQAAIVISRKQGARDKALVSSAHQKSGSFLPRGPGVTEPRGL